MCLSPIRIRNPNKGLFVSDLLRKTTDCDSEFINVPCGYCRECIAIKQMYFVQRAMMESINSFMFFSTLTYDNSHLPYIDSSTGYRFRYVDKKHLQLMFKRIRRHNLFGRPFRYFAVSERGSERGRPHVHILWFLPKYDGEDFSSGYSLGSKLYDVIKDCWSINVGSDKFPKYESLFEFHKRYFRGKLFTNYDTHFVVPNLTSSGLCSVAFYACKYLFKESPKELRLQRALKLNLDSDEYLSLWDIVRSRSFMSTSFGLGGSHNRNLIIDYIKKCISDSDKSLPYPQFFNPDTGQSFPLSPFYKCRSDIFPFWVASEFVQGDVHIYKEYSASELQVASSELERISNIVDKDLNIMLNFDFE